MNEAEKRELKDELKRELSEEFAEDSYRSGGHDDEYSLSALSEKLGLSRRQALQVMGLVAVGYALSDAVAHVTAESPPVEPPAVRMGEKSDPLDEIFVDSLHVRRGQYGSLRTESLLSVPQVRAQANSGSGTKSDPYVVPGDILEDYVGLVNFGKGWFEVDGLETMKTYDYSENSVYLQGDGARTTTLHHAASAPSTPTVAFVGSGGGNFGGIRDMTVYGAGEGDESGEANVVESDGDIIDLQFENVIIRYGGNDGLNLAASGSGTRVVNCWIENVGGTCLSIGGGSRIKVDNLHAIGGRGIYQNGMWGQFSNLTLRRLRGRDGIRLSGSGNFFTNVCIHKDVDRGVYITSGKQFLQNLWVTGCERSALITGGPLYANTIVGANWGRDYGHLVRMLTDDSSVSNVWGVGSKAGYSRSVAEIDGDNNYVNGLGGATGTDWELTIAGGTENVLDNVVGVPFANISDNGTRTLINRWGTNDGAPTESGEWNAKSHYAGRMGATVWDTTRSPWTAYRAQPNGHGWVKIS